MSAVKIIIGYLKFLNRVLQHFQIDLADSDIDLILLQKFKHALASQSSELLDVNDYLILMHYTQQHFQRPIAFVLAEHATLQDLGLIGYLTSTSLDLEQALQLFGQYYSLLYQQTNQEELLIEQQQEKIILQWQAPFIGWQNFYELNLALIYKITELIVENELIPPHYIILGYPPQFPLYYYEKFFKTSMRIQNKEYGLSFPSKNLQMKNIAADSELNQVLSLQAKNALQPEYGDALQLQQFKNKIKRLIEKGLISQQSLQPYVAQQLHCSERTLQRQLQQYQLNFQQLVDECRYEQAQLYLKQGKSFVEIANLLNYADQSAFSRAFKRWSGQTPRQFLQQLV